MTQMCSVWCTLRRDTVLGLIRVPYVNVRTV